MAKIGNCAVNCRFWNQNFKRVMLNWKCIKGKTLVKNWIKIRF